MYSFGYVEHLSILEKAIHQTVHILQFLSAAVHETRTNSKANLPFSNTAKVNCKWGYTTNDSSRTFPLYTHCH